MIEKYFPLNKRISECYKYYEKNILKLVDLSKLKCVYLQSERSLTLMERFKNLIKYSYGNKRTSVRNYRSYR